MAIGRLYYFTLSILALGFCCATHYHMWPEKGYAPHKNVGNKHRKIPKEQKQAPKKEKKERKKRESEDKRRKSDHENDEPVWIADFNSKRKGASKPAEPAAVSSTGAPGRPRKVSFEDEQPPNVGGQQQNGDFANGYVPYDYIYGKGAVKGGRANTVAAPGSNGNGRHEGSVRSPDSNDKHSNSSKGKSKHATTVSSVQGLGLSMECEEMDIETHDSGDAPQQQMAPPNQLGSLHKRRAETSPEKFNTGQFEPLQPQALNTTTKNRIEDGTPRAEPGASSLPQRTQLTAFLSDFNLTPSTNVGRSGAVNSNAPPEAGDTTNKTASSPSLSKSQLTAGLAKFSFATPTAYAVPFSAIPPTPKRKVKKFNLIDAFCSNNQLLLLLTSYLNIPSLISLYTISKGYHHQFNCHYTAHILSIMRTWAPRSEEIFPWRSYKKLCTKDPSLRQMSRLQGKEAEAQKVHDDLRDVPTIRWLQMVVYRHAVCTDILIRLASYGHRCPAGTLDALKRLWFLLDLPINPLRILVIHSKTYISNTTLTFLTHLFIKLDMHFTEPIGRINPIAHPDTHRFPPHHARKGFVGTQFRQVLLGERSLTPLWRVLRGWTPDPKDAAVHMDGLDIVRLWVRHFYESDEDLDVKVKALRVMGVPWHDLGATQMERTDRSYEAVDEKMVEEMISLEDDEEMAEVLRRSVDPFRTVVPTQRHTRDKLVRVDQLIMREGVRRELNLWQHWVRMMVWGWYDPVGRKIPILSEEQLYAVRKGILPKKRAGPAPSPGQVKAKDGAPTDGEVDENDGKKDDDQQDTNDDERHKGRDDDRNDAEEGEEGESEEDDSEEDDSEKD